MSFRERMNVKVSNAERQIHHRLNEAKLYPMTQKPFCLLQTIPDFFFPNVNLAVFIDGMQVHKHPERDEELRRLLKKRHGVKVLSLEYKAPLTKKRLSEIVDRIIDDIVGYRKDWR